MGVNADRFILLDRDGVINEDRPGSVRSESDFVLLPHAPEAIAELNDKGYHVLVVTNQACVGRGELAPDELERIHDSMLRTVRAAGGDIERIYVCPHTDEDGCNCRKPRPGLLTKAQRDFGFEPSQSWMIGDARRDIEAARSAGVRPALVRTDQKAPDRTPYGVPVYDDLMHFARDISSIA
ncbi:MAG: D-glycero-beta-D-manno-heptose 1,7-bisphosphate 7-phosphatase [Woeseia sp.]